MVGGYFGFLLCLLKTEEKSLFMFAKVLWSSFFSDILEIGVYMNGV